MPKPTKNAIARKPLAIIILKALATAPATVLDYDFEWFDTEAGQMLYWKALEEWCVSDVKEFKDIVHTLLLVSDTASTKVDDVAVFAPLGEEITDAWITERVAIYMDNPSLAIAPAAVRKPTLPGTVAKPKGKAAIRGRAPSAAGVAMKAAVETTVKAPRVRKPLVKSPVTPNVPEVKAVALKARLAAKRAAKAAEVKGKAETQTQIDAGLDVVERVAANMADEAVIVPKPRARRVKFAAVPA